MSGPKKADVQAALRAAAAASRRSAALVAAGEMAALNGVMREGGRVLGSVQRAAGSVHAAGADLAGARADLGAVRAARAAVVSAQAALAEAVAAGDAAESAVSRAEALDREAASIFESARTEYDRAERALNRAGGHYLRAEMAWAQRAKELFDQAEVKGEEAVTARRAAREATSEAIDAAGRAQASVTVATTRAEAALIESDEVTRAEAEANRIADENRRRATLAVEAARSALAGLDARSCDKFCPGRRAGIQERLVEAEESLRGGDSADAASTATSIPGDVEGLAAEAARARADHERRQAKGLSALAQLEAAIGGTDPALIADWSDSPGALDAARAAVSRAQSDMADESFEAVVSACTKQVEAVSEAIRSAADALAANDRRDSIGEAVMDVLEEMGFDVSYEKGSKSEPMRIAGQTSDADGTGDFDLEIPLDGEIDFEVTAVEGDGSCAAAVQGLQERLAERGIAWQTTDWGYGHRPTEEVVERVVTETVQQTRTKKSGR